jgi:hypothetical protein
MKGEFMSSINMSVFNRLNTCKQGLLTSLYSKGITFLFIICSVLSINGQQGNIPNRSYPSSDVMKQISPQLNNEAHNQPSVLNGYVVLAGNGIFRFYDISDPYHPNLIGSAKSSNVKSGGEAESHTISYAKVGNRLLAATVSGYGIDIWDWTDMRNPKILNNMRLSGIDHGDFTGAVWGVAWQAPYIYVGGTNTGLSIIDASDPSRPRLVKRMTTSQLGGISAGLVFVKGNLLIVTTPKESTGLATLDISNPTEPSLLDSIRDNGPEPSYIGSYHKGMAYLLDPMRVYDVTTDPSNIRLVKTLKPPKVEYFAFQNDLLFMGGPATDAFDNLPGGVYKFDHSDFNLRQLAHRKARYEDMDDQFIIPVGNLLVVSDDEGKFGSFITVHQTSPDNTPPSVSLVLPKDKSTSQAVTSRIGITFDESIELASVNPSTLIVRPLGGAPLSGSYSSHFTLINFAPDEPLKPDTTYEVIIPAGGIKDYVGNAVSSTYRTTFSTGRQIGQDPCNGGGSSCQSQIKLRSGWNLISLPRQPLNTDISSVLSSISGKYTVVYAYDGTNYQGHVPGSNEGLSKMEAGRGYWISMNEAADLTITGTVPSKTINLKEKWNLVGFNSISSMSTSKAVGSLGGGIAMYGFSNAANSYVGYVPPSVTTLSTLEPGQGYWLYVPASTSWTLPN